MASSKVSSLTASDALAGTELFYADGLASAAAADVKVTATQIKTWTSASPTLVTPALGTPSSGVATNLTGTASGLTAGTVTTNANLTGPITSSGNATAIASQTGTGTKFVVDTSPTLVTPALGVATATSVAIGGATLGTNALAVTGTVAISGNAEIGGVVGSNGGFSARAGAGSPNSYANVITSTTDIVMAAVTKLVWSPNSPISGTSDTNLSRNAAGVIQFGTTAANAAGSWLATNGTINGGTLTVDNAAAAVSIFVAKDNNSAVFTIADGGTITTTARLDVGTNVTVGNDGVVGRFLQFGNRTAMDSPSDGVLRISNNAQTDFTRLQFGGTTSSFPAIGRSTTRLVVQLADGTAGGGVNFTTAAVLSMTSGTNQRAGNVTLVGGTVTVSNTTVTANTVVMLTRKTSGGTIGTAITYTLSAGTSFTINSDNILDTSTFSYVLIEVP